MRKIQAEKARRSLLGFCTYTYPDYKAGQHHVLLAEKLEAVERGEIDRLMVSMAPRHGKSEEASIRFPAWYLGRNAQKQIIGCSYSADLAHTFSKAVRDTILSEQYADVFDARLDSNSGAVSRWRLAGKRNKRASYIAAGVGGPITGEGADLLIIDDPIKNPLAIDTPVPTPDGWKMMGELAVGDMVFDHAGQPTMITRVSERWDEKRHRIHFSDHSYIDAHPDHLWTGFDRKSHSVFTNGHREYGDEWWRWKSRGKSQASTVTTSEIADSVTAHNGMANWTIPNARALVLDDIDLLVDPYVLGLWLGDGGRGSNGITAHKDDVSHYLTSINDAGYFASVYRVSQAAAEASPDTRIIRFYLHDGGSPPSHTADSLPKRLREIGVWMDKHVPDKYMRAGYNQRLELLRGLMDADGTGYEQSVFCNKNERLVDAVCELAISLGGKATKFERQNDYGLYWIVTICSKFCPFSLPRKCETWRRLGGKPSIRRENRTIIGVEVLDEVVEHVCITVDSESHLFLAGRSMVPTHNSEEAESETYRNNIWNWYITTARTRLQPGGALVVIQTRWHEDDLAGRLLEQSKSDPKADQWEVLHLPAIDDLGNALWPEMYDIDALEQIRASIGARQFEALYQGRPTPPEGGLFKRAWFSKYLDHYPAFYMRVARYWDLAATRGGDWTCGALVGIDLEENLYILDVVRIRDEWPEVRKIIVATALQDGPEVRQGIEVAGMQTALYQDILTTHGSSGSRWEKVVIRGGDSKEVRAGPWAARAEAGKVHLMRAEWNAAFVAECCDFPYGQHDDQVDAVSGANLMLMECKRSKTEII